MAANFSGYDVPLNRADLTPGGAAEPVNLQTGVVGHGEPAGVAAVVGGLGPSVLGEGGTVLHGRFDFRVLVQRVDLDRQAGKNLPDLDQLAAVRGRDQQSHTGRVR